MRLTKLTKVNSGRWLAIIAGAALLSPVASGQVIIDDHFDDGNLATNAGPGSGFVATLPPSTWQPFYLSESNGTAILSSDNPGDNTNTFGNISSVDSFNPFLATQLTRITWDISSIKQRPLGRGMIGLNKEGTMISEPFQVPPNRGGGVSIQVAGDVSHGGDTCCPVSNDGPGSLVFWTTGQPSVRHVVANWSWGVDSTNVPSVITTREQVSITLELTDSTYSLQITGADIYNLEGSLSGPLPVAPLQVGLPMQVYSAAQAWFQASDPVSRPDNQDGYTRIEIDRIRVEQLDPILNEAPTANAGANQSIRAGDTVSLDGSGSSDDNTATASLDYAWTFNSVPAGSAAVLSGADTATPGFEADIAGTYIVTLVVTDESGLESSPATVEISSDNLSPTSEAGDDSLVIVGSTVVLDGSASSDPESDSLSYDWMFTSIPGGSGAVLTDANTVAPSFTADAVGIYDISLEVSDFIGAGTPDSVSITATSAEDYAEFQIVSASTIVSDLDSSQVTTRGNKRAFLNFLSQAVRAIQDGDTATAIDKLNKSIARTDGCEANGIPDGNGPGRDWITDCQAQAEVLAFLREALNALTS